MILLRVLSHILILSLLASCNVFMQPMPKSWDWGVKARPLTGVRNFPPADTMYGRGFKDGCEGVQPIVGKGAVDFIQPKFNPTLMTKNPDYYTGYFDGHEQCIYIMDHDVL